MKENRQDLIDRNILLPNGVFYVNGNDPMISLNELLNRIANAPTVDAVPVVRCKDCIFGELDDDCYLCRYNGCDWNDGNHFCSYGERKS